MKWSPAIAGRRGKCKCGATIQVPARIEPAAEAEADDDDLLSALEKPIRPVVEPSTYAFVSEAPAAAAAVPAGKAAPLAYARPAGTPDDAEEKTKELIHEIVIPLVVLTLGYVAILIWLAHHGALVATAVLGAMVLATVLMLGKTIVLGMTAWVMSRKGGSFGHPVGTILKIAGLVVALDAATVWAIEWMVWMNMIDHRGRIYIHDLKYLIFMLFVVTLVAAMIVSYGAFGLRDDEAGFFSRFMAGGNLTMNVALLIIIAVMVSSAAQQSRTATAQVTQAGGVSGIANPHPVMVVLTPEDRALDSYIVNQGSMLLSPKAWRTSVIANKAEDAPASALCDQLEAAGATKIYIDSIVRHNGLIRMIILLPTDGEHRDACCAAATAFRDANPGTFVEPEPPTSSMYMEITVPVTK